MVFFFRFVGFYFFGFLFFWSRESAQNIPQFISIDVETVKNYYFVLINSDLKILIFQNRVLIINFANINI